MCHCVYPRGLRPARGCSSDGQVLEVVLKLGLLGGGGTQVSMHPPPHTHIASSSWNTNSHLCWGCTQLAGTHYSFSWSFFSPAHIRV